MGFEIGECVVALRGSQTGFVGIVSQVNHYNYVVQFGADGPSILLSPRSMRSASRNEARHLTGVGGAKIRNGVGELVELDYD